MHAVDPSILAIHEAGHALMAALGPYREVRRLTLRARPDLSGNQASMESRVRSGIGLLHLQLKSPDVTWTGTDWFQGAIFLAGPLAEIKFAPQALGEKAAVLGVSLFSLDLGWREQMTLFNDLAWLDDLKPFIRRREIARSRSLPIRDNAGDLEKAVREKLDLPEVEQALRAVAEELLAKETIGGKAFYEIITPLLKKRSFFRSRQSLGG